MHQNGVHHPVPNLHKTVTLVESLNLMPGTPTEPNPIIPKQFVAFLKESFHCIERNGSISHQFINIPPVEAGAKAAAELIRDARRASFMIKFTKLIREDGG